MRECASIIINSLHLFQRTRLNKRLVVEGGGGFKEQMKMNLYAHSMKKNCLIFQTTERVSSNKLVGSC